MINLMGQLRLVTQQELREDKDGGKVHIIPDVHGNKNLLRYALQEIEDLPLAKNDKVVVMGNFIGEHGSSRDVINLLRSYEAMRKEQLVVLQGQNEHNLLLTKKKFFANGLGRKIVNQYRKVPNAVGPIWNEVDMTQLFSDMEWLNQKPVFHISRNYIFVHSGLAPSVALSKQNTTTCLYIQEPFHKYQGTYYKKNILGDNVPARVVHSNTSEVFQSKKVKYYLNRIDVGTLVDPGKEIAIVSMGDSGKNFSKTPEVNRIWIDR